MTDFIIQPQSDSQNLAGGALTSGVASAQTETPPQTFAKGEKVRIAKRAPAFDPSSRENFYVAAHTSAVVVPSLDQRNVLKDHLTVMLTSPDNGSGRIVQVEVRNLVKQY